MSIATDKRGYPHNIFLISRRKHMLWILSEYPQHMFSSRNKKNYQHFSDEKSALSVATCMSMRFEKKKKKTKNEAYLGIPL